VIAARAPLAMLLAVATTVTGPGAALAQQAAPQGVPLVPAEAPPAENAFQLGLARPTGPWPDHFLLFDDFWSAEVGVALRGLPSAWGGGQVNAPQQLVGLRAFGLGVRFGEEPGPDGTRRLTFAPLFRGWDELSGWEKFGLALQYAGAAAAVGHFVGKAVK
jgi:hypothetical protein